MSRTNSNAYEARIKLFQEIGPDKLSFLLEDLEFVKSLLTLVNRAHEEGYQKGVQQTLKEIRSSSDSNPAEDSFDKAADRVLSKNAPLYTRLSKAPEEPETNRHN